MQYRIKSSNGTYYKCRTGIGPCFGASKDGAMVFTNKFEAVREMGTHFFAFIGCEVEESVRTV